MKEATILIVDDEPRIRRFVRTALERCGWGVLEAATGAEAIEEVQQNNPDCVLLDIMLPDIDGFEVIRTVRELSDVPILMLTGRADEDDRIKGLDLGADDYIVKPFGVRELMARVRANLRRSSRHPNAPDTITEGPLTIDFAMHRAVIDGQPVQLTPTEFELLAELALNRGHVMLPADLLSAVWGPTYVDDLGLLRTAIWRLRRKLELNVRARDYVVTVPRVGYTFGSTGAGLPQA